MLVTMLTADCQVTSELPALHVGMFGLQNVDLPPSCHSVLASQGSAVQVTWITSASIDCLSLDSRNPYDLIVLDCRMKPGKKRGTQDLKNLFGNALVMGLTDEESDEIEGEKEAAVDWLVKENSAAIAMQWAIQEGRVRQRLIIERNQLRRQLDDHSDHHERAEIASTVLHNVGNVLNSVNVAVNVVHELVNQSSVIFVHRIAELLKGHSEDWEKFLTQDPKGKRIPSALVKLGTQLKEEQGTTLKELEGLIGKVNHVKQIIFSYQTMAKSQNLVEPFSVVELLDQAVDVSFQPEDANWIRIQRDYHRVPPVVVEKHQLLQILVNLLRNAKQAMQSQDRANHLLTLRVAGMVDNSGSIIVTIRDTGIGIAPQHLEKMFTRGFTTKHDGNGIGLHSSMHSIQRMGGQLQAHSEGVGTGATLTLILPAQKEAVL